MTKKNNTTQKEAILRKELVSQICQQTNGLFSKKEAREIIGELSLRELENRAFDLQITNHWQDIVNELQYGILNSSPLFPYRYKALVGNCDFESYDFVKTEKLAILILPLTRADYKKLLIYVPKK